MRNPEASPNSPGQKKKTSQETNASPNSPGRRRRLVSRDVFFFCPGELGDISFSGCLHPCPGELGDAFVSQDVFFFCPGELGDTLASPNSVLVN